MKKIFAILFRRAAVGFLLPLAAFCLAAQDVKQTTSIAVVVDPQNSAADLKLSQLRKFLLGEQTTWPNHQAVVLVLRQPGTPEQDAILRSVLQMSATEFRQHWTSKVFRGEAATEPLTVPSSGLASDYVANHPGSITFVKGTDLRKDLKVLKVEGTLPGDPRYPIR
jgi:ABC-type phosphate transport system substrate-binding protein